MNLTELPELSTSPLQEIQGAAEHGNDTMGDAAGKFQSMGGSVGPLLKRGLGPAAS